MAAFRFTTLVSIVAGIYVLMPQSGVLAQVQSELPHFESNTDNSLEWPWNHHNDTSSDKCNAHLNCTSCTISSSACHWCAFDSKCHAKASIYGCAIGASCPDNSGNKTDKSCKMHKNCTECSLSSNLCHWCAFDDECHAIGSWFGCAHGVNCYSNDRCKRLEPEKITPEGVLEDVGIIPVVAIICLAILSLCCSSVMFAGVRAVKGAYDDWAIVAMASSHDMEESDDLLRPDEEEHVNVAEHESESIPEGASEGDVDSEEMLENGEMETDGNENECQTDEIDNTFDSNNQTTTECLLSPQNDVTAHPSPSRLPRSSQPLPGSHMKFLMNTCRAWYGITIFFTILLSFGSIYYFPKVPEFNVCSDEFAWKSIIDGMTSLKVEASFEVLASIQNRNHLGITLEGVGGKFTHDGEDIGTFTMGKTIIAPSSISDVLMTCTVTPDRWETLGLISDYYKGNLQFLIDVNGSVKISGIQYSFPIVVRDVLVKVNDSAPDDRHLCQCPQWKDLYPTQSPLSFMEAMQLPEMKTSL